MMKLFFVLKSGLILSLVGILLFIIHYVFDYSPFEFVFVKLLLSILIITWVVREYVYKLNVQVKTIEGFFQYSIFFIAILFFSSLLNLSFEYALFNVIDSNYKYELEEEEFQKVSERRRIKNLPPNYRITQEEIEFKYGLSGLYKSNEPVYVLNFITVLLFYLVALFFTQFKLPVSTDNVSGKTQTS